MLDRIVADDVAIAHDHGPLAKTGDVRLVRDHDDRQAHAVEVLEDAHDLDAGPGIEVAGRFVSQQQFRPVDQRTADGDPLLLAAGELVGMMSGPVRQTRHRQCV